MTSSTDIIAKFEEAFEAFEAIDKRPTDLYVTQIYDATTRIQSPVWLRWPSHSQSRQISTTEHVAKLIGTIGAAKKVLTSEKKVRY